MPTSVPSVPRKRVVTPGPVVRGAPSSAYMRGGPSSPFNTWLPALRDASEEVRMSWRAAAARAHDMLHNSGWIAGSVDQSVANTVGTGLRLSCVPDHATIGMTRDAANEWARRVEGRFELWARNPLECDIEGRRNFGQMQATSLRGWFPTGEIVAELPWKVRAGAIFGTKVRLVPAHRLVQTTRERERLFQGVRIDADGLPIGYRFSKRTDGIDREIELRARDNYGRPRVVHIFDGLQGQVRGISPLTPALSIARRFDQLSDSHLTQSLIKAIFAATIESSDPTEDTMKAFLTPSEQAKMLSHGVTPFDQWAAVQEGWYQNAGKVDLGINGRFVHLFPGQKLSFHASAAGGSDYRDQALFLLREILRCLGLTFESGTGDYTNATYSSVRMATSEIFLITVYRRRNIVAPFCQAAFEAWLEEDIDKGFTPFPGGVEGFLEHRSAAARAEWRGTPKPQADDLKTAKALEIYRRMGVISDEYIANELGLDIEDVYEARNREAKMREINGDLAEWSEPGVNDDEEVDRLIDDKEEK